MPVNKNALFRYRLINKMLTNKYKKYPTVDDIIEACENQLDMKVSERTIREDLRMMKDSQDLGFFAPIKFDKSKGGYCYENPDFSIDKIPLNDADFEAIGFAATLLSQFKDSAIFERFSGAIEKLLEAVNVNRLSNEKSKYPFISFEKVPYYKGGELLEKLIGCIQEEEVVSLEYKPFNTTETHKPTISPYLLKEYKNRWYLIGYNHEYKQIRTYGLDRIETINLSKDSFYREKSFNPEEYFKYSIGITVSDKAPVEVVLAFKPEQAKYIKTQFIHESQKIVSENEKETVVSLNVYPTYELLVNILSYGKEVKVISPDFLVEEVKKNLKLNAEQY